VPKGGGIYKPLRARASVYLTRQFSIPKFSNY